MSTSQIAVRLEPAPDQTLKARGHGAAVLLASVFLLPFANGRNTVAFAAWLAPVFLLRFLRSGGWWRLPAVYGVLTAAWAFQFRGMVPAPQPVLAVIWLG